MNKIQFYINHYVLMSIYTIIKLISYEKSQQWLYYCQFEICECLSCKKIRGWQIGPGEKICTLCIEHTMLTRCENCDRKILTNIRNETLFLNIRYCKICVEDLQEESIKELSKKITCHYDKTQNKFTYYVI